MPNVLSIQLHNKILNVLPAAVHERLFPFLELVQLAKGQILHTAGTKISHVYFPTDAVISLLHVVESGACSEVSLVGNEGMVGTPVIMGAETTPYDSTVLSPGYAYRLSAAALKAEFNLFGDLMKLLLTYTQSLMTQVAQTAICYRHHSIDQHVRRFLLLMLDRLPSDRISITQETIATMLGVRREGVTEAVGRLQRMGVISSGRGYITITDRQRLEAACCECYAVVKKETARLMPVVRQAAEMS